MISAVGGLDQVRSVVTDALIKPSGHAFMGLTGGVMHLDLNGKAALVCGASQGIGRATALALAEAGARIVALARSKESLDSLVSTLPGQGHIALAVDVGDRKRLSTEISDELKARGAIQILICNTGGPKGGPITEAAEAEFLDAFQKHVLVNQLLTQLLLPGMKESGYGRILNIISTSVKMPIPNLGVSNTIRAAVANWAKTLSLEVAPHGITVNNILPGYTETPRLEALAQGAAEKQKKSTGEIREAWLKTVPMGRFGRPEETAAAVAFLASPWAGYITGVNLPVDGGRTGCL